MFSLSEQLKAEMLNGSLEGTLGIRFRGFGLASFREQKRVLKNPTRRGVFKNH